MSDTKTETRLYEVTVERTLRWTIYVEADSKAEAEDGGEVLASATPEDDFTEDITVGEIGYSDIPRDWQFWAGGPDGGWTSTEARS